MADVKKYLLTYRPTRANMIGTLTAEERQIIGDHFEFLKKHFEEGKVTFVGRFEDASAGLAVFTATSDDKAQEFAGADPVVKAKVFSAEVKPFQVFFPPN